MLAAVSPSNALPAVGGWRAGPPSPAWETGRPNSGLLAEPWWHFWQRLGELPDCLARAEERPRGRMARVAQAPWHNAVMAFGGQVGSALTLVEPGGVAWSVGIEEVEDRWVPLGGQFLLAWETRLVCVGL